MSPDIGGTALMMGGGGARSAYQVGVLRALARHMPEFNAPILTGISAGAINTAHLANHPGPFPKSVQELADLWASLDTDDVFVTYGIKLLARMIGVGMRLSVGFPRSSGHVGGMVDTKPLRATLMNALGTADGSLPGIAANIESGKLAAVALVATKYATNQTVTFFTGREIANWQRPKRRSVCTDLTVDHVMASTALPLFFPPARVGDDWYGDGGIRLTSPLAPAVHLGAGRILAISTRYEMHGAAADARRFEGTPRPAQVLSTLWSSVFLDQVEQDAITMQRINRLLAGVPEEARDGLRPVDVLVVRPSKDLGLLAGDFEPRLPATFRSLTRRWGTKQAKAQDLLSTVMFQHDYVQLLMEIGEEDGDRRAEEILTFLGG